MNKENKDAKEKDIKLKKGKPITVISKDGKKKFVIEPKEDKTIKIKKDKGAESKSGEKVNVKMYEKGSDDKFPKDVKEEGEKDVILTYDKGTFWSNVTIKKIGTEEVKEGKNVNRSFHWPFWVGGGAILLLFAGGIIWWIMASRKEDKEEGDL